MGKWEDLRSHFITQIRELGEDDDCSLFYLEVLDLMDEIEEQHTEIENDLGYGTNEHHRR